MKHTLTPHWNDTKYCLVQEPKTQSLHVELADHDAINLKVHCLRLLPHQHLPRQSARILQHALLSCMSIGIHACKCMCA